jgi:O-antigen ligase
MAHQMDGSRPSIAVRSCLVLCGLLVTAPFLFPHHYFPFPTFYTEWLAFALGLAALAAMGVAPSSRPVPVPAMCLGLLAYVGVLALQAALGQVAYPLRSAMGALYPAWAALIVLLGAWLSSEVGEGAVARPLQWWLAIAGTVVAASGFLQYYHTPFSLVTFVVAQPVNFMFGLIGQSNNFANYLGVALVSIAALHARRALGLAPAALMSLLVAGGMALSGSRAAWGYFAITFAMAPLLVRGDGTDHGRRFLRVALLAFAAFSLVQLLNLTTDVFTGPEGRPLSSGERFAKYLEADVASAVRPIRLQLFLNAWLMFLSSPILGIGFGEYAWRSFELAATLPGVIPPGLDRHSHNLFLQLLAETGVAGFLCIAVPLASWLLRLPWRRLDPERCWVLGVVAIIGLHSMVEFPLWHANFLGLFALLFGLLSTATAALPATRLRRGVFLAVLAAGWLTALNAFADYRYFESWFLRLEAEGARGTLAELKQLDVLLTDQKGSLFAPYFDRLLSEMMAIDEHGLADKIEFNRQVMRIYPVPSVVDRQILLLALAGRDEEAARVLRSAARVFPEWMEKVSLPRLEALAKDRPRPFADLVAATRADLAAVKQGRAFAPLTGKR